MNLNLIEYFMSEMVIYCSLEGTNTTSTPNKAIQIIEELLFFIILGIINRRDIYLQLVDLSITYVVYMPV